MQRRKEHRLKGYDYSFTGYYFVTICTDNLEEYLGSIENCKIKLSDIGEIVKKQWLWLEKQYKYVEFDEWVIMPNHLHGIIIIKNELNDLPLVEVGRDRPLQKIKPLAGIIGAFKTTSSKLIHQSGYENFKWQRSFYDHIIRSDLAYENIQEYIRNNIINWDNDRNKVENLYV